MTFVLMAARRRRHAGSQTLSQQVQSLLAGTTGFALDPSDLSTLWQDTGRTSPVTTSGQAAAALNTKFGTTSYGYSQATASWRPASSNLRSLSYATDDFMGEDATHGFYASLTGTTFTVRAQVTALSGIQTLFHVARADSATATRFWLNVTATGALSMFSRREDAIPGVTTTSAAGVITAGVPFTAQAQINFSTNAIRLLVNGTEVATGTQSDGVLGAASAAGSPLRIRFGGSINTADFLTGLMGRAVWSPSYDNAQTLATVRAYAEEVAL